MQFQVMLKKPSEEYDFEKKTTCMKITSKLENLAFDPPVSNKIQKVERLVLIDHNKNGRIPALFIDRDELFAQENLDPFSNYSIGITNSSNTKTQRHTILYSHGNAENLETIEAWLMTLSQTLDCNILAYEYDGYGDGVSMSPDPSRSNELDICSRAHTAYLWLVNHKHIPPETIILFGFSIGSVPTLSLAILEDVIVAGIIIQSSFLSACTLFTDKLHPSVSWIL